MASLLPAGVVTTTLAVPGGPAGVVAVMVVSLTTVTPVAAPPANVTPVAPVKPVPVMVTEVPPAGGPDVGLSPVTVGRGPPIVTLGRVAGVSMATPEERAVRMPTIVFTPAVDGFWAIAELRVIETTVPAGIATLVLICSEFPEKVPQMFELIPPAVKAVGTPVRVSVMFVVQNTGAAKLLNPLVNVKPAGN